MPSSSASNLHVVVEACGSEEEIEHDTELFEPGREKEFEGSQSLKQNQNTHFMLSV